MCEQDVKRPQGRSRLLHCMHIAERSGLTQSVGATAQAVDEGGAAIMQLQQQGISEECCDLIAWLMQPSQDRRPTASQALQHSWVRPACAAPSAAASRISAM